LKQLQKRQWKLQFFRSQRSRKLLQFQHPQLLLLLLLAQQ
jgi:hypothetical protein